MSNYIPNYQKKNRIFTKRERTLLGAIKRNEPEDRLANFAEKLRQSKLQAIRARAGVSEAHIEKWERITPQEIVHDYRTKCEHSRAQESPIEADSIEEPSPPAV